MSLGSRPSSTRAGLEECLRHPTSHSRLLRIDPLYAHTHTHSLQQGLSRCLGRAAGMPPQGLCRVGWMEFSPGEVEEAERRYIYPLKASSALRFWLWLRDGCGSGFRFLRARHPHSSIRLIKVRGVWVQVSGQILAFVKSTENKKNYQGGEMLKKSSTAPGRFFA